MSQKIKAPADGQNAGTSRRFFANYYERTSNSSAEESFMKPIRQEIAGQAYGQVLEIGAGNGLNFAFYRPDLAEHVEATEPDKIMLRHAGERAAAAAVPVNLIQSAVESLPFADQSFDSAVVTLVFCSVNDPARGLSEVWRVLKPGGTLLMAEHVRSKSAFAATLQTIITPITRLILGNCHWNRDTEKTVRESGFTIEQKRELSWSLMPFIVLRAQK